MAGLAGLLCPVDPEGGEGFELSRVESFAALALVGDPDAGAVFGSVREVLDVCPAVQAAVFPFEVLRKGLDALV